MSLGHTIKVWYQRPLVCAFTSSITIMSQLDNNKTQIANLKMVYNTESCLLYIYELEDSAFVAYALRAVLQVSS